MISTLQTEVGLSPGRGAEDYLILDLQMLHLSAVTGLLGLSVGQDQALQLDKGGWSHMMISVLNPDS